MNKPLYQKIIEVGGWMIGGTMILGAFLDGIANAVSLINLKVSSIITISLIVFYLVLQYFFKNRRMVWVSDSGQILNIIRLSKKLKYTILGALILLWIPVIFNFQSESKKYSKIIQNKPIFDLPDTSFKILILPFDKECDYQGTKYDIGKVVSKRLEILSTQDTLNLKSQYLSAFNNFNNFTPQQADSLMIFHHADLIIYGSYSLKECENGKTGKICFNYRTDTRKWNFQKKQNNSKYKTVDFQGIEAIRNGIGQEDIEYIIYYISGLSAWESNKFLKSNQLFQKIKNYPQSEIILFYLGYNYTALKQYDNAKRLYFELLKLNPKFHRAWCNLGVVYRELKEYKKAKECYQFEISYNPTYPDSWLNLGCIYLKTGDNRDAELCFLKAIELDTSGLTLTKALYNLGMLYKVSGRTKDSIEMFEALIDIDSVDYEALIELLTLCKEVKDWEKSKIYTEKAIKISPKNDTLWNHLIVVYKNLKKYDKAKECAAVTLKLNPKNEKAYYNLGLIDYELKNNKKAIENYKKALELNPKYVFALVNLGVIYYESNEFIESKKYIKRAVEFNPKDTIAQNYLNKIEYQVKMLKKVRK